jgi:nucleotide-binding universal stress UspA family protein
MNSRVVVGVDFSDPSRTALEHAAAWAQRLGIPLMVVHVLLPPAPISPEERIAIPDPACLEALEDRALGHLKQWTQGIPHAATEVRWGSPAEGLMTLVDPDSLLVVGQVGHSRMARFLFGSTVARVVNHAPCDVLVVRRGKSVPHESLLPA